MCKCSQDNCDLEVFENSNKCILHCEKNDWSSSMDKINFFWNELNNTLKKSIEDKSLECNLNSVIFPAIVNGDYPKVAIFEIKLLTLQSCTFLDDIDLSPFLDAKNLEITRCTFYKDIIIKDVIHKGQFIFQNNIILKNIKFSKLMFEDTCVFILNKFKKKLTFDGVRFKEYVLFNNSEIENLFFRNTFFRKESNFLDIKLSKVGSRETARIIKDSFEQQNNIIEANKFYALEMEEREKELDIDIKKGKNFFEWLVFKIHGLSSNHSQDWLLALFWIFVIGFISSYYDFNLIKDENKYVHYELLLVFKTIGLIVVVLFLNNICKIKDKFVNGISFIISFYFIYIYATEDYLLSLFSKTINPFSVMKSNDPINGIQLFFKIIITYLIYQLIISIRQNTRRK